MTYKRGHLEIMKNLRKPKRILEMSSNLMKYLPAKDRKTEIQKFLQARNCDRHTEVL